MVFNFTVVAKLNVCNMTELKLYPEVFTGLGRLVLEENSTPVVHAFRNIPVSLRNKLKVVLNEVEAAGVIEKVEQTEWVNSLLVIESPYVSLQFCLDPRDLNEWMNEWMNGIPIFHNTKLHDYDI